MEVNRAILMQGNDQVRANLPIVSNRSSQRDRRNASYLSRPFPHSILDYLPSTICQICPRALDKLIQHSLSFRRSVFAGTKFLYKLLLLRSVYASSPSSILINISEYLISSQAPSILRLQQLHQNTQALIYHNELVI